MSKNTVQFCYNVAILLKNKNKSSSNSVNHNMILHKAWQWQPQDIDQMIHLQKKHFYSILLVSYEVPFWELICYKEIGLHYLTAQPFIAFH